jgi:deazaflavin-dependent oxidoreductase (nitroreductase family)
LKLPLPIIRLLNPLVAGILRSPLHSLLSKDMMLLTFTGRRSGKSYETPVSYVRDGEVVRCFTHSLWARNLRGGADVTVLVRGDERNGRADVVTGDVDRIARAIEDFLTRVPRDLPYYDVTPDRDGRPNASEVRRAAEETSLIEIRLA